jgi:hypothetical protein
MLWQGSAIPISPEPQAFDKGLIFVKEADILLSGDKWTIVVNIAIEDYISLTKSMRLILDQVRGNIRAYKEPKTSIFDIHWEELNHLEKLNQELENDVNSFRQLLVRNKMTTGIMGIRSKRGLLNVLGYGLKYLFGTADAGDVQRLSLICNELHLFETKMTHVADQQLTYLRTLDETVGKIQRILLI